MKKYDLKGHWRFCLDKERIGIAERYYQKTFDDAIELPATVSAAKKGNPTDKINTGFLTDPYEFEGYTWYTKEIDFFPAEGKEIFLVLERTRISHVWIDDIYVGSNNSLCTSHRHYLTPFLLKLDSQMNSQTDNQSVNQTNRQNDNQTARLTHKLTIMIDNTSYPVKGGHMTSPDTQTNWNGITGELYIEEHNKVYLSDVKIYPDAKEKQIEVQVVLHGAEKADIVVSVSDGAQAFPVSEHQLQRGTNAIIYKLDETAKKWSEFSPHLYDLQLVLKSNQGIKESNDFENVKEESYDSVSEIEESLHVTFGLRDFKAVGKYFEINGQRTFLRGKHDGLIFPLTGYAPTDTESWIHLFDIAKQYGMNHYRFHTCCPPEAAFAAADIQGIYLEPELPFWGTVTEEGEDNHDENAQQYLIEEGFRILDAFGNHPSFVMMSLGNELWGSKKRINEILYGYRNYDNRHLYTQGSNNFQFVPCILENEDFFCGVRFSKERLFRGSYAMCDAPQGHIQTMPPDTCYNYDEIMRPTNISVETVTGGEITIQYGTSTKKVNAEALKELITEIPVISHEIGQYAMFPDYSEINKYIGVLQPRNLVEFKNRFVGKGMLPYAEQFFQASGRFAAECYKAEIETALRSNELAGFQLLDLQDFTGQGTALVGILNVFMENKGLISVEEWQQFCGNRVLLAELPKMTFLAGEQVNIGIKLSIFNPEPIIDPKVELSISDGVKIYLTDEIISRGNYFSGVYHLGEFFLILPRVPKPKKLRFT